MVGGTVGNLKLAAPISEDDWGRLADTELENTRSVAFITPGGREVKFVRELGWIPVKKRLLSAEERAAWGADYLFDCSMPDDLEDILVTVRAAAGGRAYVASDVCYADDGYCLESGLDWMDDVLAWMPMPVPYSGDEKC